MDYHLSALAKNFSIFGDPFPSGEKLWGLLRIMGDG